MSQYLDKWYNVIEKMVNFNTYKPAFGRGLMEALAEKDFQVQGDNVVVSFFSIANNMIRYYWNQSFYFNLRQQPGDKEPIVYQNVQLLIQRYKELKVTNIPCWSDEGIAFLKEKEPELVRRLEKDSAITLTKDVSWRFPLLQNVDQGLYHLDLKKMTVTFTYDQYQELSSAAIVLIKLLNYKWSQLLEKFNVMPQILTKVNDAGNKKIRRNSLAPYKNALLSSLGEDKPRDFYTDKILEESDISLDHVIPWSFLYRDDIWNLVFASRKVNSSKNNSAPSEEDIGRLEKRNIILCDKIPVSSPYHQKIREAIELNLVRRFYYEFIS